METEYKSAWTLVKWVAGIVIFLLGFGFLTYNAGKNAGIASVKVETTIQIDTVWEDKPATYSRKAGKPTIVTVIDTIYFADTTVIVGQCDSVRTYPDSIMHLDYDIHYKTKVCGLLLNTDFKVDLKVPREITKTITNTQIEYKPFRASIYYSMVGSVNNKLTISHALNLAMPKQIFMVGYDPLNKTYIAGVGIKLFKIK